MKISFDGESQELIEILHAAFNHESQTRPWDEYRSCPCAARLSMSDLRAIAIARAQRQQRLSEKLKTLGVKIE